MAKTVTKTTHWIWRITRAVLLGMILFTFVLPWAGGLLSYCVNWGGIEEQYWLDRVIDHLRMLRLDCDDPELDEVLEYTIRRYNRIGPFDVSISRCDWYPFHEDTIGLNNPLVPGVTIDLDVLHRHSIHYGASLLVHEALHDYPLYVGHSHVYPVIDKLEELYVHTRANRPSPRPCCPAPDS
jgi:hypothetical protein